jgi:hypothetical protein
MPPVRKDEHPEYPFAGPFPGLQSEVAPSQIGNAGFAEVQNLLLRNSRAQIVPEFVPISSSSPDGTPIAGIFDFFNVIGARMSGVWTQKGMFIFFLGAWQQIPPSTTPTILDPSVPPIGSSPAGSQLPPGIPITGDNQHYFQWAVVGYKLYFSQLLQPIQVWDGDPTHGYNLADEWPIPHPPGFIPTHVLPVPAKYLMELDFHLVVGNTMEIPTPPFNVPEAPNRVHWSATGDGANWSDFSAGQNDLFNNLGPITGMTRLFQSGYVFQQLGVTMMTPTGDALAPFRFTSMGAYAKGNTFPFALAAFGELIAAYIGRDDIYIFDGTSSQPIGQHPIDGNRRLGARTRIFADLFKVTQNVDLTIGYNQSNVWGVIMTAANGTTMEAYWLFIPQLNKAWVYNFDESNWTQLLFQAGRLNGPALSSFWGPQSNSAFPFGFAPIDSLTIADNAAVGGFNVSYLDFSTPGNMLTSGSISPGDGWYIRSGNLDFDDNRHPHTVNKVRMVLTDVGVMQFYLRFTNETGYQTPLQLMTIGEGTGKSITTMVDLQNGITGKYITWELSGPPSVPFELVEITPYPVLGGEVMTRCEVVVSPPVLPPPGGGIVVSISPGSVSLAPGATQTFKATVTNTSDQTVTWTTDRGTITAGGLYTAPSVTVATLATVTATSNADTTKSATVSISIQPVAAITVTIAPLSVAINSGGHQLFTATVTGTTDATVTWEASAGTITSGGLFTAPTVSVDTSVTVGAVSNADPAQSASVTFTVHAGAAVTVTISPTSATLASGQTQTFTATVTNATPNTVTWHASQGTITSAGLFTAPTVTANTNVTITATSVADTSKSAQVAVSVIPAIVVTVTPATATITSGQTQQFNHTVTGTTNTNVTWTASPGTISSTGLYTAPTVTTVTSGTVTATSVANTAKHGTATVSIQPVSGTQYDLLQWCTLNQRATQHLVGDPKAPYEVQWLDTDANYPSNYPKNTLWFIKNKLGNPWDVLKYDSQHISHWMTENGDSADQAACQAANGTTCWLYARAYKRDLTPIPLLPRMFTPGSSITLDTPASATTINRTTNCESTVTVVHLGPVHCVTTGPFKYSWGGSIDSGPGTDATAPHLDSVHGVDTIKSQYYYSQDSSQPSGYASLEETYYVKGFGRVAWYYYLRGVFQQKTVNTTVASGGHPAINFPCGPGKSWFV